MRSLALLALAASAAAQAVTQLIVPSSVPPPTCENSRHGSFQLTIISAGGVSAAASSVFAAAMSTSMVGRAFADRDVDERDFEQRDFTERDFNERDFDERDVDERDLDLALSPRQVNGQLGITLSGGVLHDTYGRTGYIASNYQFQFDKPPQAGAIYTAGFSICSNGSLALGGSAVFWQCKSGSFYNLYDRNWALHCEPVYFQAVQGAASAFSTTPPGPESTGPDQATIKNAGGTQSQNNSMTSVGFGGAASTTASASASGSGTGTGSGSGSTSGGGSATAKSSSGGAAGAGFDVDGPQALGAWVIGILGAVALL